MSATGAPTRWQLCGIGDEAAVSSEDQVRIHRDLGWRGVELRTCDGTPVHALDDAQAQRLGRRLRRAGLEVPVVDTPIGGWSTTIRTPWQGEVDVLRRAAGVARRLGCRRLRVMSYPNDGLDDEQWRRHVVDRMRRLTAEAERCDVVLLHENCHGWAASCPERAVHLVEQADSEHLRLLLDTGNGVAYGYDALELLRQTMRWVEHVHVKDGRRTGGQAEFCPPGDGDVDVPACLEVLAEHGYTGWLSLEPHVSHMPHLGRTGSAVELEAGYRHCADRLTQLARGAALEPAAPFAEADRG